MVLLELLLRVYNPFPSRIKGNKIYLNVSTKVIFENTKIPKLDKEIINSTNSLGFRGEEPPKDYENYLKIFTSGGSSTKCMFLSDDKTWPFLLDKKLQNNFHHIWLNNVGFDGHTTFGHLVLLNEYLLKLKPNIILFLVGINDVGQDSINGYDKAILRSGRDSLKNYLLRNSQLVSLVLYFRQLFGLKRLEFGHAQLDLINLHELILDDDIVKSEIEKRQTQEITLKYESRIKEIIEICKKNKIEPIFLTQPSLIGKGIDPVTGVNLEQVGISKDINGKIYWGMLERLNNITKKVCKNFNVHVIDLANLMPRNSNYYYDEVHFTSAGAEKIAELVFNDLLKYLTINYKNFLYVIQRAG